MGVGHQKGGGGGGGGACGRGDVPHPALCAEPFENIDLATQKN